MSNCLEKFLDTLLLFRLVSATYWKSKDQVQDDSFPLFFNTGTGKVISTKNMYNQQGFKDIGIPELRSRLMHVHMTNKMFESGATTYQHVLLMAHSEATAPDSYFTKGTEKYNAGMAKIIKMRKVSEASDREETSDEDDSGEAADRREEMITAHTQAA